MRAKEQTLDNICMPVEQKARLCRYTQSAEVRLMAAKIGKESLEREGGGREGARHSLSTILTQ